MIEKQNQCSAASEDTKSFGVCGDEGGVDARGTRASRGVSLAKISRA